MVTGSQQLVDDYEQLKNTLELYPSVQIVNVEGQPPDSYEIVYELRGYTKNNDNQVEIASQHRVCLSLPFGYPHFAPTVKPLTRIFHPDIDPDAIRIAGRWQDNPSLSDLVLYIGEMISGAVYNLEDPFNQEAAEWYAAHSDTLPLDDLKIADIIETDSPFDDDLVDDTFASLGLETNDYFAGSPQTEAKEEKVPDIPKLDIDPAHLEEIKQLIAQRQIFTANTQLSEICQRYNVPDMESMQQEIGKTLRKTDQLFKLAEQHEDKGNFAEAMDAVNKLLEVAADAPGAKDIRERIRQSAAMFDNLNAETSSPKIERKGDLKKSQKAGWSTNDNLQTGSSDARSPLATRFEIPFKLILTVVIFFGVVIGGISLYFKDQYILSKAQADFLKSQLRAEKGDFESSLDLAEEALDGLSGLTVLRFSNTELTKKIKEMVSSRSFQEGLQGRVLYNNEYISSETATALKQLSVLTDQARKLMKQKKNKDALTIYRQALLFCQKNNLQAPVVEIQAAIDSLQFNEALTMAEKAELDKNWKEAEETYRKALELSPGAASAESTNIDAITHKLTAATFRKEMDESMRTFTEAHWQQTIDKLEKAQQLIKDNPGVVSPQEKKDLEQLLEHARLYQLLGIARQAYEQGNWRVSISNYEKSLNMLTLKEGLFQENLQSSRKKIKKTLLLVRIAEIQDDVLLAEQAEKPHEVIKHLKRIQHLANTSIFKNDAETKMILRKVTAKIARYEEDIYLAEKISYLSDHFEKIFRANYPTFKGSKLSKPRIEMLREVDNLIIFKMSCVERAQGSSSRLELVYQLDRNTGQWSVYNE
ncbi:MAG: hypothetical protein CSA34_05745 [Desulfobulbus propionicus]|nr:MAG: hypothetical protein CSA34_05745 [Desulfobulbus propionicus]